MEKLKFKSFDKKYKQELNSWHSKEWNKNTNGLTKFIVPEGVTLGDYIEFAEESLQDVKSLLIFDGSALVGFLGFSNPEKNHVHIEFVGVNPDDRGKGYANRILADFKNEISEKIPKASITLEVNKLNLAGIKSFSKSAKLSQKQDREDYIQFEL